MRNCCACAFCLDGEWINNRLWRFGRPGCYVRETHLERWTWVYCETGTRSYVWYHQGYAKRSGTVFRERSQWNSLQGDTVSVNSLMVHWPLILLWDFCLSLDRTFWIVFACTSHTRLVTPTALLKYLNLTSIHRLLWNYWWRPIFWIAKCKK